MTDVAPTEEQLLLWYRADRPVPLVTWLHQDDATQRAMAAAATQVALERSAMLAAVFADPGQALEPLDGGQLARRRELMAAMAAEQRRGA